MSEQKEYLRFSVVQRLEHWAEMLSFTGLTITGIPQKFVGNDWAEALIGLMGGIEMVRNIHHISAVVMAVAVAYHIVAVAYKIFVLRVRWTMFPRVNDILDALDVVRYNLGLTKEHPKLDRFNFAEKFEYWAFVWGAILMGLTGFLMWNPINAIRFVSGDVIPAAKAAHGAEAILAALAIVVWHFYNVHIKMFNKSMFTGKMSAHQMEEEHGYELQRIAEGRADKRPDAETIKRRERMFIPIAVVASVLMLVSIYFFVSYEETALTTVPKQSQKIQIFAPLTPTAIPRPGQTPAAPSGGTAALKPLPASHDGRTTCNTCHANNIGPKNPADHAGRSDSTCTACHKFASSAGATSSAAPATTGGLKPLPVNHDGRTTCNTCHANNIGPKNPADHAGRTDTTCTACHKFAGSASAPTQAPAATQAPATSSASSSASSSAASSSVPASTGVAKPLPASHEGRATCNACHENNIGPKNPADHAGRTDATCAACHKSGGSAPAPTQAPAATKAPSSSSASSSAASSAPAATKAPSTSSSASSASSSAASKTSASSSSAAAGGPKVLPAGHAGRTICLGCHQNLPQPAYPADHAGRTEATCIACHKLP